MLKYVNAHALITAELCNIVKKSNKCLRYSLTSFYHKIEMIVVTGLFFFEFFFLKIDRY